jgi:hypothetical protein
MHVPNIKRVLIKRLNSTPAPNARKEILLGKESGVAGVQELQNGEPESGIFPFLFLAAGLFLLQLLNSCNS